MGDIKDDKGDQTPSAGDLRAQLEAEQEKNRKLAAENQSYQQTEQLRELGFGHLNKRQQRTLIRDLADEGKDLDANSAAEIAKEYGWSTEAPKPNGQQGQQDGQQGDQQEEEGPFDDGHNDALSAIGLMQRASRMSANTPVGTSFEDEMKKTSSREELRSLIRSKGPRHGIMHEWDVP